MKKLAIIGGGIMALNFAESCKQLHIESHYFSQIDGKINDGKADVFHEVNIFDKDKIVEICKKIKINGVVATTELTIPITAYVAEKLGLLGNPIGIAEIITDKYRNRECIKGLKDLHSPMYVEARSMKDIENSNIPYPLILKPVSLGGKRGISVVNNNHDLQRAYSYAVNSFKSGVKPVIIAEEFLNGGIECSVESLSINGKHIIVQITKKDSSGAPHCVELGHHQPAPLEPSIWNKIINGVTSGLTAIGIINGPCHTEVKIINDKVYLIEFNARPGGDNIAHPMIKLSTGFDYISGIILATIGDLTEIDTSKFEHNYSGMYYVVKQTSYLKKIFDTCEEQPWCWKKNYISDNLEELINNDMENTNYFIYHSKIGNPVDKILINDLNNKF